MKPRLLLCLALVSGGLGWAQEPTSWRPNIAADSEAATWKETAAFIVNTINNGTNTRSDVPADSHYLRDVWVLYNASASTECEITLSQLRAFGGTPASRWEMSIDLQRIDPFSIRVEPWSRPGFQLVLSGFNDDSFERGTTWKSGKQMAHKKFLFDKTRTPLPSELFSFTCEKDKTCTSQRVMLSNDAFPVTDFDMSMRLARAFMHAALICGGTKARAISSF